MGIESKILSHISERIIRKCSTPLSSAFNKAGARVASKGEITSATKLKFLKAPQNTATAEVLNIEKSFGKETSQIISFKDEYGKLLKRLKIDNSSKGITETTSKYDWSGKMFDVERSTTVNGKLKGTLHSKILAGNDKKPHCTQATLKTTEIGNGSRKETQVLKEWMFNQPETTLKTVTTKGIRYADGSIKLKKVKGNVENLAVFKQDPYIMIRNYTNEDFCKSLLRMISERYKLKKVPKLKLYNNTNPQCHGFYRDVDNSIALFDVNKNHKANLIDTMAHELRHAKQHESSLIKALLNRITGKDSSGQALKFALNYAKAEITYPYPVNMPLLSRNKWLKKLYTNNRLEVDASKYGYRIQNEYIRHSKKVAQEIDYRTLGWDYCPPETLAEKQARINEQTKKIIELLTNCQKGKKIIIEDLFK